MIQGLKWLSIPLLLFLVVSTSLKSWLPDTQALKYTNPKHTTYMGDKRRRVDQRWVPLSAISKDLQRAVIISEDGRFYQHFGIDIFELKESIKRNARDRSFSRGFSTITMQLARNLYLTPTKDVSRKFKEIIIALKLEHELSKPRILELYLNVIEWGRGIYGIEAAAQHYFKKSAAELNSGEAAFLAAIIPSPQRYGKIPPGPYIQKRIEILQKRMIQRWGNS